MERTCFMYCICFPSDFYLIIYKKIAVTNSEKHKLQKKYVIFCEFSQVKNDNFACLSHIINVE